jgi:transposase InsO family protein
MNERVRFIAAFLENQRSFIELCGDFGISRKQGYKWRQRYDEGGVAALVDRSRAPHHHPNSVSKELAAVFIGARKKHPRWGPRKLLVIVRRQHPGLVLPAASTVGEILKKAGLIGRPKRRRRSDPYRARMGGYDEPNAVWCADFKGHFPVAGKRCHPLTVSDGFSRYLLCCQAMPRPLSSPVQVAFERLFRQFGMPRAIRTDNGPPFSTLAPGGLSRLAIWWIRLGIRPERIMPGRPDQNGRHERMHLTLKNETAKPPRSSFRAQQRAFDRFRSEYNLERPHEALNQTTPASHYCASPIAYPSRLPELEYPSHYRVEKLYPNGVMSVQGAQWYVSGCLANESVGLEEVDDDRYKVHFGPVVLGILDVRNAKQRSSRQFGLLVRADGEMPANGRRRYPYRRVTA